jgi:hypothetical protein
VVLSTAPGSTILPLNVACSEPLMLEACRSMQLLQLYMFVRSQQLSAIQGSACQQAASSCH